MTFPLSDITAIAPEIGVLVLAILVVLVELTITRREDVLQVVVIVGLALILGIALTTYSGGSDGAFNGMIAYDGMALFFKLLLMLVFMV